MKKAPAVDQSYLLAFESELRRQSLAQVDEIVMDLEDIPAGGDDDYVIRDKALPPEIPKAVRQDLVAKTRAAFKMLNEVQDIIGAFDRVANKILAEKTAEDERNKPHCDMCGQVVKAKSKKRR